MYSAKGYKTAEISKPIQYSGDIYYIEVNLPDGRVVLPISEGQQQCEILLAIVMPDYGSGWDSSNDFSAKGVGKGSSTDGTASGVITPYVPVYINGKLYYGEEPDGTKADGLGSTGSDTPRTTTSSKPKDTTTTTTTSETTTTETTTTTTETTTTTTTTTTFKETTTTTTTTTSDPVQNDITTDTNGGASDRPKDESENKAVDYGDANCDGTIDMADAVLIMQALANPNKYGVNGTDSKHITEQGAANADVDTSSKGLTSNDALQIQLYLLHKIKSLDPAKQ